MAAHKSYTPEALARAAKKYFRGISCRETVKHPLTGKEELNDYGEPVTFVRWLLPPTEVSLCRALKMSRETLRRYKQQEEYREVIEDIESLLLEYNQIQLLVRDGRDLRGVIFNLQNNFGHREKVEIEQGERAARTAALAQMSMSERAELVEKLLAEARGETEE